MEVRMMIFVIGDINKVSTKLGDASRRRETSFERFYGHSGLLVNAARPWELKPEFHFLQTKT